MSMSDGTGLFRTIDTINLPVRLALRVHRR
ncbi:hypothetical protein TRIP_E90081 [uncultured Spirochaetota bacterium]|uniref:Uncharacterized protein n=1 Tax=uncultured Spirochaetota bacterium TaxID=460511 RepID=A0A652ZZN6_9SPIR|nr:hypothetical protein TRIP_E90081 [uncultured Spirochaetota bacterium]